jgi:energy-converting hydrogenase Eha subunit F
LSPEVVLEEVVHLQVIQEPGAVPVVFCRALGILSLLVRLLQLPLDQAGQAYPQQMEQMAATPYLAT